MASFESQFFDRLTHVIDGQHIRGNRGASGNEQAPSRIHVHQYVPKAGYSYEDGDVTIIATHASGFTKELYAPLFDDLFAYSKNGASGFRIRSIWIADASHMGYSAVENTRNLGNSPHYFDHSRDLMCLVNTFRSQMTAPIIGIGHSLGTTQLAYLSAFHPRLFTALAFVETIITDLPIPGGEDLRTAIALKQDFWPTREAAEGSIRKSKFFSTWDPRAVDLLCATGFVETPNVLFPESKGWTTVTPKHQEVFSAYDLGSYAKSETNEAFRVLPLLQPPVLYVQGRGSALTNKHARRRRLQVTGTTLSVGGGVDGTGEGGGGSGGTSTGQVREVEIEGTHFVAFENPKGTAGVLAEYLREQVARWRDTEQVWRQQWANTSVREKQVVDEATIASIRDTAKAKRSIQREKSRM